MMTRRGKQPPSIIYDRCTKCDRLIFVNDFWIQDESRIGRGRIHAVCPEPPGYGVSQVFGVESLCDEEVEWQDAIKRQFDHDFEEDGHSHYCNICGVRNIDHNYAAEPVNTIRQFDTGANRDTDEGKLDFEGFLSPLVLLEFAKYMHKARHLKDGTYRDSDNWQKGMPFSVFMKSCWRHFMDMWLIHRGYTARSTMKEALCGVLFNVMGYLHEILKEKEDEE